MKVISKKQVDVVADIICDVCAKSTSNDLFGPQYGTLNAHWGYGSKHDGERYEVHLCESCFFGALANLRRERQIAMLFTDEEDNIDQDFGVVIP